MNKKIIGSILGGVWGISMASLHFREALMKRFGLNTEFAFSELGNIYDNVGIFITAFFASFFGIFIACYMMKEKPQKVGCLTILIELFFVISLLSLLSISALNFSTIDLSNMDINSAWPYLNKLFVLIGGFILATILGGIAGIFIGKYIIDNSVINRERFQITDNENLYDYFDFYFARRGRSFFSIMIFFGALYWAIFNIPNLFMYLRWIIIGPWFVLFHPVLWWVAILWFAIIPIGSLVFLLLPLTMLIPLLSLHWTYKIAILNKTKLRRIIYILLLYLALGPFCGFLEIIGKIPIAVAVTYVSYNGQKVWEVLLDKYSRPIAYEQRYEYLSKSGQTAKAQIVLEDAIEANYNLGNAFTTKLLPYIFVKCSPLSLILFRFNPSDLAYSNQYANS